MFSAPHEAGANEFKLGGQWLMGFAAGEGSLVKNHVAEGQKRRAYANDKFTAALRLRLPLDAVASESLSGTVYFEIGDTTWDKAETGGALGADGTIIELKHACIDWIVLNTALAVRMGVQGMTLPYAAGGSAVPDDAAGVVASCRFNDNVGLTLSWVRPCNDDCVSTGSGHANARNNYLDNLDLISLAVPLDFDSIEATPWVMYGIVGQNALRNAYDSKGALMSNNGNWRSSLFLSGYDPGNKRWILQEHANLNDVELGRSKAFTSGFRAGLPIKLTLRDPVNIEFDINYG